MVLNSIQLCLVYLKWNAIKSRQRGAHGLNMAPGPKPTHGPCQSGPRFSLRNTNQPPGNHWKAAFKDRNVLNLVNMSKGCFFFFLFSFSFFSTVTYMMTKISSQHHAWRLLPSFCIPRMIFSGSRQPGSSRQRTICDNLQGRGLT